MANVDTEWLLKTFVDYAKTDKMEKKLIRTEKRSLVVGPASLGKITHSKDL